MSPLGYVETILLKIINAEVMICTEGFTQLEWNSLSRDTEFIFNREESHH